MLRLSRPFFERPEGGGGGGTATAEGDEGKVRTEIASDDYLKAVADMTAEIKRGNNATEELINKKLPEMLKDVRKAAKSNRVIDGQGPPERPDARITGLKSIVGYKPVNDFEREICRLNDRAVDVDSYYKGVAADPARGFEYGGIQTTDAFKRLQDVAAKAAGDFWESTGTAAGSEWIPTGYSSQSIDVARLPQNVAASLPAVTIPQGVGTWRIPVKISKTTWALVSESSAIPSTVLGGTQVNPGTGFVTLSAKKHRGIAAMSVEMTEDAAVQSMQMARSELFESAMDTQDSVVLNGQTTAGDATFDGTNGPAASNGWYNGLRYYGVVTNANLTDGGGTTLTVASFETARASMGIFGVRPSDLRWVMRAKNYLEVVTDTDVKTVDVLGPRATIVSGQLASCYGTPLLVSDEIPTNLATADARANTPGTQSASLVYNVLRWRYGTKRRVQIAVVAAIGDDSLAMYGFIRHGLDHAPPDTDAHVAVIRNITG